MAIMEKNILLILALLSSCSSDDNLKFENQFTLVKRDSITFELDSISTARSQSIHLMETEKTLIFSFLNRQYNSIYFYDFNTTDLLFIKSYPKEGLHGVGKISAHYVHSLDSIYLFRYDGSQLYLTSSNQKIKNKFSLLNTSNPSMPPFPGSTRPIIKLENKIFITAWGDQKEYYKNSSYESNKFIELNVLDSTLSYFLGYPAIYNEGVWGIQFHVFYHDFNETNNSLIISYPIDNNIYKVDLATKQQVSFYAGSTYFKEVAPLSNARRVTNINPLEEVKNQLLQSWYGAVKYDEYRNVYYRIVHHPIEETDFQEAHPIRSKFQPQSIIILNKYMEKIGEVMLPKFQYFTSNLLITERGLYIEKLDFENEDLLSYDLFTLEKIK